MAMDRRVEVLFEPEEYEALRLEAARRGVSFGELVRDAARRLYLLPDHEQRVQALERLTQPGLDLDWDEAKRLIGRYADREP
jgi:hypothetical protein